MADNSTKNSVRRLDFKAKVTGRAVYLADMQVPGMCYGRVLRSQVPHALIKSIDASNASKIPGVLAVLTRDDIVTLSKLEMGAYIRSFYGFDLSQISKAAHGFLNGLVH